MKNLKILILISVIITSCKDDQMKFESEKWKPYESGVSIGKYRSKMVNDLVENVLKTENKYAKGSTYKEVIKLIGEPESIDTINGFAKFLIEEKTDYNIDPNGYTYLYLYFKEDSLLRKWEIVETEFKP